MQGDTKETLLLSHRKDLPRQSPVPVCSAPTEIAHAVSNAAIMCPWKGLCRNTMLRCCVVTGEIGAQPDALVQPLDSYACGEHYGEI